MFMIDEARLNNYYTITVSGLAHDETARAAASELWRLAVALRRQNAELWQRYEALIQGMGKLVCENPTSIHVIPQGGINTDPKPVRNFTVLEGHKHDRT
jgi:hypothetical protein